MLEENGRIEKNLETSDIKMDIEKKIICSECGSEIIIKNKEFGKKYFCTKCGEVIKI